MPDESPLNIALRLFEIVEANFLKADKVLKAILAAIPNGITFGSNPEYEDDCRSFMDLWSSLPPIDGWKPEIHLMDLDEIAQSRLDAEEIGEIELKISIERSIDEPSGHLREYHYKFNRKRKELIREAIGTLIEETDMCLTALSKTLEGSDPDAEPVEDPQFEVLKGNIDQIDFLLGSSVSRPQRWSDLRRHLHFGLNSDLHDIIKNDWPNIKGGLKMSLYTEKEPIPVEIEDLGDLARQRPKGKVATRLLWEKLSDEDFERLVFALISSEKDYENPSWLTRTNAPDRGRDLSVERVHYDSLGGTIRQRVIIQCKHWLSRSIGPADIATLKEQMKLWEPPRVDVHIIATSGRFSSDAVAIVEKHNQSDSGLRIEMWPESHLEILLAHRPAVIAEFSLR